MDLIPKFKMDYVYPAVIRYILFNTPEEQKTVTPEEKSKYQENNLEMMIIQQTNKPKRTNEQNK